MDIFVKSERGKRKNNEDSYFIKEDGSLLILADGMGGHAAGEQASRMAIDFLKSWILDSSPPSKVKKIKAWLLEGVLKANDKIYRAAQEDPDLKGMGTTLSLVLFKDSKLYYVNIGDSRIYIVEGGRLVQLSRDDSFVNYLVEIGDITAQEARAHPQKNILTKALGTFEELEVEVFDRTQEGIDQVLLCTDGLTDVLEEDEISSILQEERPIKDRAQALVDRALDLDSRDNITVILLDRK